MKIATKIAVGFTAVGAKLQEQPVLILLGLYIALQKATLPWGICVMGLVGCSLMILMLGNKAYPRRLLGVWCLLLALLGTLVSQLFFPQPVPYSFLPKPYVLTGVITHKTSTYCDLKVKTCDMAVVHPTQVIRLYGTDMDDYLPGDEIFVNLTLQEAGTATNPGQFDYRAYLLAKGISAVSEDILTISKIKQDNWYRYQYNARQFFAKLIKQRLPDSVAGVAVAMLMGDKSLLSEAQEHSFQVSGVAHLLVVSGLHLSMLASGLLMLWVMVFRRSMRISLSVILVITWFYVWVIGCSTSVLRAAIMLSIIIMARLFYLPNRALTRVISAALVILIIQPQAYKALGFQLSFAATSGIIWITPLLRKKWGATRLKSILFATLAALSMTFPLLLYHYHTLNLYSILANLSLIPLAWLCMLSGFLLLLPGVGLVLSYPATWLFTALLQAASFFAQLPFASLSIRPWPLWLILIYYATWATSVMVPFPGMRKRLLGGLAILVVLVSVNSSFATGELEVTYLDVGQGDSIYVRWPNGYKLLIDGGLRDSYQDLGKKVVLPFLRWSGVNTLDAIMVSHADADHSGGLLTVLEQLKVKTLYVNEASYYSKTEQMLDLLNLCRQKGVQIEVLSENYRYEVMPGSSFDILSKKQFMARESSGNNSSIVLRIVYGGKTFLFTGDIEESVEYVLCHEKSDQLDCDFLKVPHHGSKTSSTEQFLKATSPELAICSVGRDNRFGHPDLTVINNYEQFQIPLYRTDRQGAITVITDGNEYKVETFLQVKP